MEKTLVLLKPDAVQRSIISDILKRFERVGLKIVAMKMKKINKKEAQKHYPKSLIRIMGGKTLKDYKEMGIKTKKTVTQLGNEAYKDLVNFITEGPLIALILEGPHAVSVVRKIVGPTSPQKAPPGTIRGDFSPISMGYATIKRMGGRNIIHASGTREEAKKEIGIWFNKKEIYSYKRDIERQL